MLFHGNIDGQNNRLVRWLFESVGVNPGHVESKFFYNTTNDRVNVGTGVGYQEVAYLSDLVGFSKWKYNIDAATTGPITLTGEQTVDDIPLVAGDRVLVKDQADQTTNGYYTVSAGAWTRITEADTAAEIENSQVIVEWGTDNGGTIWKNQNADGSITQWTTPIIFSQLSITVPTEDKFVKVSLTDTTEKYLSDAIYNSIVTSGPAIDNQSTVKLVHINQGADETISFGLDLTNYTGNMKVTGNFEATGVTTLNDVNFTPGATIDWTDTTQTGVTTFDAGYNAAYAEWSTININGTTTYGSTSNTTGNQNFDSNYTWDYVWSSITYSAADQPNWCNVSDTLPLTEINPWTCDKVTVELVYSLWGTNLHEFLIWNLPQSVSDWDWTVQVSYSVNTISVTQTAWAGTYTGQVCWFTVWWLPTYISNEWVNESYSWTNTVDYSGTLNNNYAADYVENNVYEAGATINNDGTVENNYAETYVETNNQDGMVNNNYGATSVENNTYTAGSEINNTGDQTINNTDLTTDVTNTNTTTNISGGTTNYTDGAVTNYDSTTQVTMEGDTNIENLSVTNISYAESYVAGEALTNRQPLRLGKLSLGENVDQVYGANATDTDHSAFIGFASKNTLIGETLAVLQWPRVIGLSAVYGNLVDTSEYFLTDAGGIGLVAGTVSVRIWDADGTDALVGLNAPLPAASLVPPKQLKANNVWTAGQVATLVDQDTFEWQTVSGWSIPKKESFTGDGLDTTWVLTQTPIAESDIVYNESGLVLIDPTHYSISGTTLTFTTAPANLEKIYIKYDY